MGAIKKAGLSEKDVTIMNMPPDQIAAAWQQDAIDAAFIWQPVQAEISKNGKLLVGADQIADWGIRPSTAGSSTPRLPRNTAKRWPPSPRR